MHAPKIKVVAYSRVSTLLSQDPEHQLHPIRELAKNRGYDLVEEFTDRITGTAPTEKRKALDELVKQARQGRFKIVIIYALDRLGRDLRHLLNLLHDLDQFGVTVISVREALNFGDPMGRACIALIGILSQLEKEWISQRIKTALAVKKMTAQQTGNGWTCGRKSVMTTDLVAEVRALRTQGLSIRQIEKAMGKTIARSSIAKIVKAK